MPYVIMDGHRHQMRTWDDAGPAWTLNVDEAIQFHRREDANKLSLTDEDAWYIITVEEAEKIHNGKGAESAEGHSER